MKLHLRADIVNDTHTRFTVFMNGANCGQLCMRREEAFFFHDIISLSGYRIAGDEIHSSGHWITEEERTKQEEDK